DPGIRCPETRRPARIFDFNIDHSIELDEFVAKQGSASLAVHAAHIEHVFVCISADETIHVGSRGAVTPVEEQPDIAGKEDEGRDDDGRAPQHRALKASAALLLHGATSFSACRLAEVCEVE